MPTKSRAARSVESDPDDGDSGADDEGDVGEGEAAAPRLLDTSGSNAPRPPPTCDADEKQAARAQKRFKTMKAESRSLHGERALARIGVATIFATSSLPRFLKPLEPQMRWRWRELSKPILPPLPLRSAGQLRHNPGRFCGTALPRNEHLPASLQQGEGADPDMDLQALLIKHNLSRVSKLHGLEADGKLHTHDAQRNRVL